MCCFQITALVRHQQMSFFGTSLAFVSSCSSVYFHTVSFGKHTLKLFILAFTSMLVKNAPLIVTNHICLLFVFFYYQCLQKLCCKATPPPRPEYDVVCIGLSGAGKTSLLSRLCNEISDGTVPTTGNITFLRSFILQHFFNQQNMLFNGTKIRSKSHIQP